MSGWDAGAAKAVVIKLMQNDGDSVSLTVREVNALVHIMREYSKTTEAVVSLLTASLAFVDVVVEDKMESDELLVIADSMKHYMESFMDSLRVQRINVGEDDGS